ncbi:MAG: InlB B-repeat-containing protein [Clostridia bacterium]|nr:InlB B-repeat-containing protein [Clostridia bacterium]
MFRATQKIKTWLFACLMAVVTPLVAVSACLLPTSTVANAADESATWTLVTDAGTLLAGDEIIIAAKDYNYALSTTQNGNNRGQAEITKSDNAATLTAEVQQLTLEEGTKSGTFAFNTGDGYLFAASSNSNYLRTESTLSANSSWTISIATDGTATVKAQGTNTRNWMRYNNSSKIFAAYASGQKDIVLYKLIIENTDCDHANTELIKNNDGTHKVVCANETCKKIINPEEQCVYSTLGSWETVEGAGKHERTNTCACGNTKTETAECSPEGEGVVTPPTATEQGYTTYVCKDCGGSYQDDFVPALSATKYTVSYVVPTGVKAIAAEEVAEGFNVTLPAADNAVGYTFVGWTTEEVAETKTLSTDVYTAEYTVTEDVTFYALYSQTIAGEERYVKVTQAPADWSGTYLIVYENGSNAYVFKSSDTASNYLSTTITNDTIAPDENVDALAVTIAPMAGGYSILTPNGYIYGTSGSNKLNFNKTSAQVNTLAFEDGTVKITSNTSVLRYNATSGQTRFRYFKSDTYTSQKAICLYKLAPMMTTTYQTLKKVTAIDSATLTVKDDLTVNYYVNLNDCYVGAQMKFTMLGEETVVDGVLQADGRYKYSFTDIAPQYMGENIKAELVFNGEVLTTVENYSVQQYVKNQINNENQTLKRLLSDLLYYGDAAQKFVGYNEENLVSAGVDGLLDKATANPTTVKDLITEPADSYPIYFKSAGMLFDNVNKLYVRLEGALDGATLSVAKDGVKVGDYALTSNVFYTDGIVATDFDAVYTFELYVNNTKLQTLTYSVNSYAYAMQDDAEMAELAAALYNYGAAAEAYNA